MMGKLLKISIFGESHGEGVGLILEGFPAGIKVDHDLIRSNLARRAGGNDLFSTPRKESDDIRFVSGIFEGYTTGAPICILIPNENTRSGDYAQLKSRMRPNHSDYTAQAKYHGYNDYRGGGHFSGRLTTALVAGGALAIQYLSEQGIKVGGHIFNIGEAYDDPFPLNPDFSLINKDFPVLNTDAGEQMKEEINHARMNLGSVGGSVEVAVTGVPVGIGEPFFDSVESILSHWYFSIPAVKAVEFGLGMEFAESLGSEVSDSMYYEGDKVLTKTNNCGGICGGITNGMPIKAILTFKPTSSIAQKQQSVNLETKENITLEVKGRHDPCIVKRAVPVVESVTALALLDLYMEGKCR
ncbi:MAG: chorismate synthase [Eubacteriales bacterium]|nr:chorismate synthase [Eubacteriales bacterium]